MTRKEAKEALQKARDYLYNLQTDLADSVEWSNLVKVCNSKNIQGASRQIGDVLEALYDTFPTNGRDNEQL